MNDMNEERRSRMRSSRVMRVAAIAAVAVTAAALAGCAADADPTAAAAQLRAGTRAASTPPPTSNAVRMDIGCTSDGFTGTATVSATRDAAAGTVTFVVERYRIVAPQGSEQRTEANLDVLTSESSLVPGTSPVDGVWKGLSGSLAQDATWRTTDFRTTVTGPASRSYTATYMFTFDRGGSDPWCYATDKVRLVAEPPAPTAGANCSLPALYQPQACWRSSTDQIVTVKVTDKAVDMPQYIVLNTDYGESHRGRFAEGTYSRITLHAGQSLALTSPSLAGRTNAIQVFSARPLSHGVQPEVGEECVATGGKDTACFVVAPKNYKLQIRVTGTPYGNAPAYYVSRNGVVQHSGRLDMSANGSTIWVAAGDRFYLTHPTIGAHRNVIQLTEVTPYSS